MFPSRAIIAVTCSVLVAVAAGVAIVSRTTSATTPFSANSASLGPFAGYNIHGKIRSLSAEWRVSKIATRTCGDESTWIGAEGPPRVDGVIAASTAPFAQIGTTGTGCLGRTAYRAFWSATSQGFLPHYIGGAAGVGVNDLVSAAMSLTGEGWVLRFTDITRGWSASVPPSEVKEPVAGYNLAEFLQEDPGASLPFYTHPVPYATTTTVDFSHVKVDGTTPRVTFSEAAWMGLPGPVALAPRPSGSGRFSIQARRLTHAALQYLSDVVVRNNAVNDLDVVLDNSNPNSDPPQLARAARSNILAGVQFDTDLREQRWPAGTESDITRLLAINDEEIEVLVPLADGSGTAAAARRSFEHFDPNTAAASSALRAALGIPRSA